MANITVLALDPQTGDVTPLVKTLGQVVHNGLSVKEAMELLDTLEHEDA